MVYLIKISQTIGIRTDYFFSLLLLLLDTLKDWQMCHGMIKYCTLQTNSDIIIIFHNFAATEASKFGQLNRSVQKKEKTPSGVWICGSYGAKWTRQAPPRVREREREREERESKERESEERGRGERERGERDKLPGREKEETKIFYFACFLTWWSFIEHLSETTVPEIFIFWWKCFWK